MGSEMCIRDRSRLTSAEVAVFVYLQPIIGVVFALLSKSDSLSITIIISSILIFTGLYLTTKKLQTNSKN